MNNLKLIIYLLIVFSLYGCECNKHSNDLPANVYERDPQTTVVYRDYNQGIAGQTVLSTVLYDGHKMIIMRGEWGEDLGFLMHHPDCNCGRQ